MKSFRVLGAVFYVLGFFFALLGILASVVPMLENEQLNMILKSFEETSSDALTNTLNAIVLFCLHSAYFLLFCGISLMVAGGLISSAAHKKLKAAAGEPAVRAVPHAAAATPGVPRPAYYPGGLTPPAVRFSPDPQEDAAPQIVSTIGAPRKAAPISGGVEPAFSTDENDAQKLMRHDEWLTAQTAADPAIAQADAGRPKPPAYSDYLSNAASAGTREDVPPSLSADPHNRPKIVSTMGKRKD